MPADPLLLCLHTASQARGLCPWYKGTEKWTSFLVGLHFSQQFAKCVSKCSSPPGGRGLLVIWEHYGFIGCCKKYHLPERFLQDLGCRVR